MPDPRRQLGAAGEAVAARFLRARGYRILARNRRSEGGEIDIIARDPAGPIVFVEVRTRRGARGAAHALESVDEAKQQRLRDGAAAYLAAHPDPAGGEPDARIDVIAVVPDPAGRLQVALHIPNAVDA